ncbi:hypothetical protein QE152_g5107 [Popillia japonica]|uniref:Uncharacterized protein n=1 Tax=Popillia japonica TaxID=7064 RepID=A0AAW1MY45_POPJA
MQMVQSLQPGDNEQRIGFCEDMLRRLDGNDDQLNNLWMSDEAPPRTIKPSSNASRRRWSNIGQYAA